MCHLQKQFVNKVVFMSYMEIFTFRSNLLKLKVNAFGLEGAKGKDCLA